MRRRKELLLRERLQITMKVRTFMIYLKHVIQLETRGNVHRQQLLE